jgi:hypothetical protein
VDFLYFWPSKICVSPTDVVSSLSSFRCRLSSDRHCHAVCRVALRSHGAKTSSLLPLHLPATLCPVVSSRVETEALNLHHRRRPPSSDRSTPTLHSYKNVISTLVTLSTTQARLHFASSLARASHHWSSTRHRHSLLLSSHAHRLSAQRHPRWRTSRIFFTSLTAYWLNKRYAGLSTSFY